MGALHHGQGIDLNVTQLLQGRRRGRGPLAEGTASIQALPFKGQAPPEAPEIGTRQGLGTHLSQTSGR